MQISATGKYLRVSQRKMILLAEMVKLLPAKKAESILSFTNKSGAKDLKNLITSALNNAKNKNSANEAELLIKNIDVLPGPAMKRFRAVSRGMAHSYKKRMCHVKVVLTEIKKTGVTKPPILKVENKKIETKKAEK